MKFISNLRKQQNILSDWVPLTQKRSPVAAEMRWFVRPQKETRHKEPGILGTNGQAQGSKAFLEDFERGRPYKGKVEVRV